MIQLTANPWTEVCNAKEEGGQEEGSQEGCQEEGHEEEGREEEGFSQEGRHRLVASPETTNPMR